MEANEPIVRDTESYHDTDPSRDYAEPSVEEFIQGKSVWSEDIREAEANHDAPPVPPDAAAFLNSSAPAKPAAPITSPASDPSATPTDSTPPTTTSDRA